MSVFWSAQEKKLLKILRPYCSSVEINRIFKELNIKRSIEAIKKKSRKEKIKFIDTAMPPTADLTKREEQAVEKVIKKREDIVIKSFPSVEVTLSQKSAKTKKYKNFLNDIHLQLEEIRKETPRRGSINMEFEESGTTLCVVISDVHLGRKIETEDGILYDIETAKERLLSIPDKLLFNPTVKGAKNLNEVIIVLAGDLVDGEGIFPHHEMHIETHATEQVLEITRTVWEVIQKIRKEFGVFTRVVTTKGNHGRTGLSLDANWDNILYMQLELLIDMEGDPGLTIKNRYGDFNTFNVKGWKGLIRHKAPGQAETAAGKAKFGGWKNIHGWDFFVTGHWHHWSVSSYFSSPIFVNGSLCGEDDYAETLALSDKPCQLAFLVTEEDLPGAIIPLTFEEKVK